MATFSNNLRLTLIGTGEQAGTWGDTTNTNLGSLIEQAITGYATINIPDAQSTLSIGDGVSSDARSIALNISSTVTLTATQNVIVPTGSRLYAIRNSTLGGRSIVIKTLSDAGVTIANGATAIVLCTGASVIDPFTAKVNKDGDTMTGQLNLTATNNTPFSTSGPAIAIRNASSVNSTYAALALNNAAANSSALLFSEYVGTNASRFAIATNPGTSPTSLTSRFTVNSDGSFTFLNNSAQTIAVLDASGNLSVKGNVTAYAAI
jgi:hypothetical protein